MSVIIGTSRVTCHPDPNFLSSRNPNSYFRHPASRENFQSRILPPFCFKIPRNPSLQTRQTPNPQKPVGDPLKNSLRNRHQLVFIGRARGTRDGGWPPLLFSPRERVGPRNFYRRFKKNRRLRLRHKPRLTEARKSSLTARVIAARLLLSSRDSHY